MDFEFVSVKVANKKKQNHCFLLLLPTFAKQNNYLNHIEEVLERNGELPLLVAGDFNIDLLLDELVLRKKLENKMAAHCLSLISLREGTRETETSSSCIDANFGKVPPLILQLKKHHFLIITACI